MIGPLRPSTRTAVMTRRFFDPGPVSCSCKLPATIRCAGIFCSKTLRRVMHLDWDSRRAFYLTYAASPLRDGSSRRALIRIRTLADLIGGEHRIDEL